MLTGPVFDADDVEDLEEAPENEVEAAEKEILDQATAAATLTELKVQIATLARLDALAAAARTPSGASSRTCSARSSRRLAGRPGHRTE